MPSGLLSDGGALTRIASADLDALEFQLDQKCDGCVFSVNCLTESARLRRLELLGIAPSACRALRGAGVVSIDNLADMDPTSEQALEVRENAGFNEDLDQLVQRARARRRMLPFGDVVPDSYQVEGLRHAGFGPSPPSTKSKGAGWFEST